MGDMDPCACIWDRHLAVQRLLSILRQSQAYCTDNECLEVSSLPSPGNGSSADSFMMMCLFAIFGMLLYAFRPSSMRADGSKARDSDSGSDGEPPLPPPAVN